MLADCGCVLGNSSIDLLTACERRRPRSFVPLTGSVNTSLSSLFCPVEGSTLTAWIQPKLFFLLSRAKVFRGKKVLGEYDIKVEQVNYYTCFTELRCCRIFSKKGLEPLGGMNGKFEQTPRTFHKTEIILLRWCKT